VQIPKLRQWREARALTQEELAEKAGVSARSVAGYEAGAGARPGTVRNLAAALDIEVMDLLEDYPKARTPLRDNWASSFPEERFRRAVEEADTSELVQAMKRHVGNRPGQSIDNYRQDKESAMAAGLEQAAVFAHALIVDQELRARGHEEDPAEFLPDYRRWREATGLK
jgi:transcriptional regulator with XRE-family HTH domain